MSARLLREFGGGGYMPMDLTVDSKASRSPMAPFLIFAR